MSAGTRCTVTMSETESIRCWYESRSRRGPNVLLPTSWLFPFSQEENKNRTLSRHTRAVPRRPISASSASRLRRLYPINGITDILDERIDLEGRHGIRFRMLDLSEACNTPKTGALLIERRFCRCNKNALNFVESTPERPLYFLVAVIASR